jgi:hypothetical protein
VFQSLFFTPAAIRLVLELGWFLELGSATAPRMTSDWETAAPSDVDDPLLRRLHFAVACTTTNHESQYRDPQCTPQHDGTQD